MQSAVAVQRFSMYCVDVICVAIAYSFPLLIALSSLLLNLQVSLLKLSSQMRDKERFLKISCDKIFTFLHLSRNHHSDMSRS